MGLMFSRTKRVLNSLPCPKSMGMLTLCLSGKVQPELKMSTPTPKLQFMAAAPPTRCITAIASCMEPCSSSIAKRAMLLPVYFESTRCICRREAPLSIFKSQMPSRRAMLRDSTFGVKMVASTPRSGRSRPSVASRLMRTGLMYANRSCLARTLHAWKLNTAPRKAAHAARPMATAPSRNHDHRPQPGLDIAVTGLGPTSLG
mmetsp:Transcript_109975/g.350778  ORF Transcript_109975/g.350778 Transcript_109975/m.350778 type:complete len:202 (-) Transcript_109975:58-663(-)